MSMSSQFWIPSVYFYEMVTIAAQKWSILYTQEYDSNFNTNIFVLTYIKGGI